MANDVVRRVDYWYATVPAGSEHSVLKRLAGAKVDLLAYLAFPAAGGGAQVDVFPRDARAFERAASNLKIALSSRKQALLVEGSDRPGALADLLERLAAKGIPVTASTAIAVSGGGYGFLIFVKHDALDGAAKLLGA